MSYDTDMSLGSMGSASRRTITAFFDSRDDAEDAIERLVSAGISRDQVKMVAGGDSGTSGVGTSGTGASSVGTSGTSTSGASVTHSSYGDSGSGFWDALKDLFMPDEDRYTYAEGLRRGGYLVTVTASDAYYEQALDILDDEGTIDIGEREASWRSEGWSGYEGSSSTLGSGVTGMALGTDTTLTGSSTTSGYSDRTTSDRVDMTGDQEVIPVTEEELQIGKRDVSHGRVRVRSYTVETPVSEDVSLRDERVSIERRPVDRAVSGSDAVFQDRTIEVEERGEEAVVSKEARVTEELVIDKDVSERTQRVSDTVRRTEVEIEDERTDIDSKANVTRRTDTTR